MAQARRLIPSCSQTFSKSVSQYTEGAAPLFIERGQGSHVWDVDGNEYIDYPMALGPVILGHNYPRVTEAMIAQIRKGVTFSLPSPLEVELAEQLVDLIPCAEMVRYGKNGSDVTSGAVRAARAYTGREHIACCGYHGWQDWFVGTTTRNKGVPRAVSELTHPFNYNDISSLQAIFDRYPGEIAAVIMEPVLTDPPAENFLQQVKELAHHNGALLIFDEVITGFRLALGGAQEFFGVTPDLATFGKALGNGMPISAVVGRAEIMQIFDEIFFSFTFGGEALSLAAALAVIAEMREKDVIPHLWSQGEKLRDGFNRLAAEAGVAGVAACSGYGPKTVVSFTGRDGSTEGDEVLLFKTLFQQEVAKRGVLFVGFHATCFSHSDEDVEKTLAAYSEALAILRTALDSGDPGKYLEGKMLQPVFRKHG